MNLVAIPLDIRPYNYQFLNDIVKMDKEVSIELPLKEHLGARKNPADLQYLDEFIKENISKGDGFVISLDMLIYGGLFPSRLHNKPLDELRSRLEILREIKRKNPECKIYGSSLILRTPKYNSNEEEPEYYGECGLDIFLYGHYMDKELRKGLTSEEVCDFNRIKNTLNEDYLNDFVNRRNKNTDTTLYAIDLVNEGIIDLLIVPQDDASEYGFTAMDQRRVYSKIEKLNLADKVFLHPGTDESGCTLITRAYLDKKGDFSIYPLYITEAFKNVIPSYEDRPFMYSLISHTEACGIKLTNSVEKSDAVLAINGSPLKMQEAFEISHGEVMESLRKDISYHRYRNFPVFCREISDLLDNGKDVGVLDVAFSNGGERALIEYLDKYKVLDRISSYAGWNTCCNSLGTVLASMTFAYFGRNSEAIDDFKIRRIAGDWAYQTEEMLSIQNNELKELGGTFSNFNGHYDEVMSIIKDKVYLRLMSTFKNSYNNKVINISKVSAPFERMRGIEFEIDIR